MATLNLAADPTFIELQGKIIDYRKKLNLQKAQLQAKEHERRTAILTSKEVSPLPEDVVAYRAIGRMFIKESKPSIIKRLNEAVTSTKEDSASLERSISVLESRIKEEENNMRSFIQQNMSKQPSA